MVINIIVCTALKFTATRECCISEEDLRNKPLFKEVLMKFLSWIDDMVKLAKKRHGKPFVPGKVALPRFG